MFPSSISVVVPVIVKASVDSAIFIAPPEISSIVRSIVPTVKSTTTSCVALVSFPATSLTVTVVVCISLFPKLEITLAGTSILKLPLFTVPV